MIYLILGVTSFVTESTLRSIAEQCFREHGNVVLTARARYHTWVDESYGFDDAVLCGTSERSLDLNGEMAAKKKVSISPNPTSDFLILQSNSQIEDLTLTIATPQGKVMSVINPNSERVRFALPSGI